MCDGDNRALNLLPGKQGLSAQSLNSGSSTIKTISIPSDILNHESKYIA